MPDILSIADVERDTGLSKDTLRVWERRYGFPHPRRDAFGERVYPHAQVEKLRAIKRLLDAGHRPARLMGCSLAELRALGRPAGPGRAPPGAADAARADEVEALLALVRTHDAAALQQALAVAETRHGLRGFVEQVVAPLAARVGEAWLQGELRIFEEHLFTECVLTALRRALGTLPVSPGTPRVLLATLPGEPHAIGLLMAQTVLTLEGCRCQSLGVQVPVGDIVAAAASWGADIVALSVTGCAKRTLLLATLDQLRAQLPAATALWVGGAAPALGRHAPVGVQRVATFAAIRDALQPWRAPTPDAAGGRATP